MDTRNLEFFKTVDGIKTHYIFTQGDVFYVFTEMYDESRGNFSIIHSSEVDDTENLIRELYLRQFHPKELDKYDFNTDKTYRVQRIREICYILVAKRVLELEKVGREILFNCVNLTYFDVKSNVKSKKFNNSVSVETKNFTKSIKQKNEKQNTISLKNYSGHCPKCKGKVAKHLIKVHLDYTCPKKK